MNITQEQIDKALALKRAIDAAHKAHPKSRALTALHARAQELLDTFQTELPAGEYQTLGGGTNKSAE